MAATIRLQQQAEELVSEEVREIISYRPHWMIRKGNLIFFAVTVLLLTLTFFIAYPDVVQGTARLVALDAPKTALARRDGKLVAIEAVSGRPVRQGQPLAFIESTADFREVAHMHRWLTTILGQAAIGRFEQLSVAPLPVYGNLGEVQGAYQALAREWTELQQFFGSGYYQQKKAALQEDLYFTTRLKENLQRQEALSRQEQQLQKIEFAAYDSLAREKLVAPLELHAYQSKLIGKEQALAQADAQLINCDMAAHSKHKELLDLQKGVLDQQQKFYTALLFLKTETEKWMQQYAVLAPQAGTVFLFTPLQVAEQVAIGQELFYVQPATSSYYAQVMAGQSGLGKVKEGQRVRLTVESYPGEEYGYLKGRVAAIAGFPNRRDSFLVRIDLPGGLTTNYGKPLFFRNNLLARAEILTDDRRLIERFFNPLKKIWQ